MTVSIDIADFETQAASGSYGGLRSLSATTELMLITLYTYASEYRWRNSNGEPLTDEQKDTVDNWVAIAQNELMQEVDMNVAVGEFRYAAFPNPSDAPENWLECNGQVVPVADYPLLESRCAYVSRSGANLTLPNFNTRVARATTGAGYNYVGSNSVTLTLSQIPPHSHRYNRPSSVFPIFQGSFPSVSAYIQPLSSRTTSTEGSGQSHENRSASYEVRVYVVAR